MIQFQGHVAKVEAAPKGKIKVTVYGDSSYKGTEIEFETNRSALAQFLPGAEVDVTIAPREKTS